MLKRILTIVLILLLLPLTAAGVYGFVWWKVSTAADELVLQLSPFAQMTYAQVHIDPLEKAVGLKQISITPQGSSGDLTIDSVIVRAPSWGFLLDLQEQINKGNMPDSFSLDLKGVNINLNSGYVKDWATLAVDMQSQAPQSYDTLACGNLQYFGLPEMLKMGYRNVRSDMRIAYQFDPLDQALKFDVLSDMQGVMKADMTMEIQIATDSLNIQTAMFSQPKLQRFEMRYKDGGYNVRRNKFCAELNKEPVEQYRENYAALLNQRLKYEGWVIPEPLFDAIDSLNDPRASAYVRIDIPQGFGTQSMVMIQGPSDLLNMLSPYMELGGKAVSLDGLDWEMLSPEDRRIEHAKLKALQGDAENKALAASEVENSEAAVIAEAADDKKPTESVKSQSVVTQKYVESTPNRGKSFKVVKLSVLPRYIGQPVVLYTYFGRKVEGKLLSVDDAEVTVLHRLVDGRGTATYPIARNKIETVMLFH